MTLESTLPGNDAGDALVLEPGPLDGVEGALVAKGVGKVALRLGQELGDVGAEHPGDPRERGDRRRGEAALGPER